MSCTVCSRKAKFLCGSCNNALYCSRECQLVDDFHNCLIEGKEKATGKLEGPGKKRGKATDPLSLCKNDTDPINLEEFSTMDPKYIIVLGDHCFHLPSIYNWVHNVGQTRNPFTNQELTQEQLTYLRDVANSRFPLEIVLLRINGEQGRLHRSTLDSVKSIVLNVMLHQAVGQVDTFYGYLKYAARTREHMTIRYEGGSVNFTELVQNGTTPLYQLIGEDTNNVSFYMFQERYNPEANIRTVIMLGSIALENGWPTEMFAENLRNIQQQMRRDRLIRGRQELVARLNIIRPRDELPALPDNDDPDMVTLNVRDNSVAGQRFGTVDVMVPRNGTLADVEAAFNARVDGFLRVNQNVRGYIFAGRLRPLVFRLENIQGIDQGGLALFRVSIA